MLLKMGCYVATLLIVNIYTQSLHLIGIRDAFLYKKIRGFFFFYLYDFGI